MKATRWGNDVDLVGVIQLLTLLRTTRLNRIIARHEAAVALPYVRLKFAKLSVGLILILWPHCGTMEP